MRSFLHSEGGVCRQRRAKPVPPGGDSDFDPSPARLRGMTFASSAFPHLDALNTMNDDKARSTRNASSPSAGALAVLCAALVCGCADLGTAPGEDADPAALVQARETYVRCINAEAEKDAANPAGAEDIAVAAHARCWGSWDAYRHAAITSFANGARTREERQLAHDKADAHLRQLELETRRGVVDAIVQRTLTRKR
jgi:hypothetical protein